MNYGLKREIQDKLFHGIVMPTANAQGYTLANTKEVVAMMVALAKKYHSMTKHNRKIIISKAEKNIDELLNKIK